MSPPGRPWGERRAGPARKPVQRLLQWLAPVGRRLAEASNATLPPFAEALDPASPFARADRAMQAWLAQADSGWRVASCRVLQPTPPPECPRGEVFEFVLAGRSTQARVPPRRVLARCLPADGAPATAVAIAGKHLAVHAAVASRSGLLSVPQPLHVDAAQAVLLQEPTRGRCLAQLSDDDPPALLATFERCGAALRELHELPASVLAAPLDDAGGRAVSIAAHVAALVQPAPFAFAAQCAPLRRRVVQVMHDLMGAEAACGLVPPVPLHRRLDARRVFVTSEGIEFGDWDCGGTGDAALDLARMLTDVERRWPAHADALQAALLRGWLAGGTVAERPAALGARLHLYRAFHALRQACKVYRIESAVLPRAGHQDEPAIPLGAMALRRIGACLDTTELQLAACRLRLAPQAHGA